VVRLIIIMVAALDCSVRWRQQWRTQHDTST